MMVMIILLKRFGCGDVGNAGNEIDEKDDSGDEISDCCVGDGGK